MSFTRHLLVAATLTTGMLASGCGSSSDSTPKAPKTVVVEMRVDGSGQAMISYLKDDGKLINVGSQSLPWTKKFETTNARFVVKVTALGPSLNCHITIDSETLAVEKGTDNSVVCEASFPKK